VYLVLANIHIQLRNHPALLKDLDSYLKLSPTGPEADQARKTRDNLQAAMRSEQEQARSNEQSHSSAKPRDQARSDTSGQTRSNDPDQSKSDKSDDSQSKEQAPPLLPPLPPPQAGTIVSNYEDFRLLRFNRRGVQETSITGPKQSPTIVQMPSSWSIPRLMTGNLSH